MERLDNLPQVSKLLSVEDRVRIHRLKIKNLKLPALKIIKNK